MDEIHAGTGLTAFQLGVLGALPVAMFAVCSPFAGAIARVRGIEAAVTVALVGLVVGMLVRSLAGLPGLWLGTAVAGAAIAIANVVTPTLVKRDFGRPVLAMAMFTAALSGSAALASGTSVPLAEMVGGWRLGLLVWVFLPILVLPVWLTRVTALGRSAQAVTPRQAGAMKHVARSPIAWQVAAFFGLQSLVFYTLITWLPTIEQSFGASPATAGFHLLVFQLVGLPIGLAVGVLMERSSDTRVAAVAVSLPVVVAMVGMAAAPQFALLWVILGSTGTGSSLAVALALVLRRTSTPAHTTAVSGLAQSVGYLVACAGPIAAGLLGPLIGWRSVLLLVAGVALVQTMLSLWAARASTIEVIDVVGSQELSLDYAPDRRG